MSVELHPGIGELDPGSLCHSIYTQLYQGFFNAQDRDAVTEGDQTSVRLRNTAYNFATAIAGSFEGSGGGSGGVLLEYLKKSGGDMSGPLSADYGFSAGVGNRRVLETYRQPITNAQGQITDYTYELRVTGDLRVNGNHLYFGGQQFITYIGNLGTMFVRYPKMDFSGSKIRMRGDLLFGENRTTGIYISPKEMEIAGKGVYHAGNANLPTVDWTMRNASIAGELSVSGMLHALHGAELGAGGKAWLGIDSTGISAYTDLSFADRFGIKMKGVVVLQRSGESDIRLGSTGGDLLVGGDNTNKVRLLSNLTDADGDNVLITPFGGGYFPDSLRVRHNYGRDLLSSYRKDNNDEGIVVHQRLRLGSPEGLFLTDFYGQGAFLSLSDHTSEPGGDYTEVFTLFGHMPATSLHKPKDRPSDTMFMGCTGDFILLGNPVEATGHLGLADSLTRLMDGSLLFTDDISIQQFPDGMGIYGNAHFSGNISSIRFSSGFAGSGWAILVNGTTGNAEATFDMLTVRKRMRVYEMQVQNTRAVGGALWISDTCSADTVEKL